MNWTGLVNNKWSEPLNWDTSAVPGVYDYCIITSGNVDVDIDVHINYLTLQAAANINFNDKTVHCDHDFYNNITSAGSFDCGTSTLIVGDSLPIDNTNIYVNLNPGAYSYYNVYTYGSVRSELDGAISLFYMSNCFKILNVLKPFGLISFEAKNYLAKIFHINAKTIDLTDCIAVRNGDNNVLNFVINNDAEILFRPGIGFIDSAFYFTLNASANDQVFSMPQKMSVPSIGRMILSPFDYNTGTLYSNVTFVFPESASYGLCGSEYMYEHANGNTIDIPGGIISTMSSLILTGSNMRFDSLKTSGCNLTFNSLYDFNIDRELNISGCTIITPSKKLVFNATNRNMFGNRDTKIPIKIKSTSMLPDIEVIRCNISDSNFLANSFSFSGTPYYKETYFDNDAGSINMSAYLTNNATIKDYNGSLTGMISANTINISGSELAYPMNIITVSLHQASGSNIKHAYFSDVTTISGADISGTDIIFNPFFGKPEKLDIIDEITPTHVIWTNSGGDNLWSNKLNWLPNSALPGENDIVTFDKNYTTATCIINSAFSPIYGVSAKPYSNSVYSSDTFWNGELIFNSNSKLQIKRSGDFSRIKKVTCIDSSSQINLLGLNSGVGKAFLKFGYAYSLTLSNYLPSITTYAPTYVLNDGRYNMPGLYISKNLTIYNKFIGTDRTRFDVGTTSVVSSGAFNLYAPNALIGTKIFTVNTNVSYIGADQNFDPLYAPIGFMPCNISLSVPNLKYKFGYELGCHVSGTNAITMTLPSSAISYIAGTWPANNAGMTIDARNVTKFANRVGGGSGYGNNLLLLPNSEFESADAYTSFFSDVASVNTVCNITNKNVPEFRRTRELFSFYSRDVNIPILLNDPNIILKLTGGLAKAKSFSAIGISMTTPFNYFLNPRTGSNYGDHGIISSGNILISGCNLNPVKIDSYNHKTEGSIQYFEPSAFVFSAKNKITLIDTDFISCGHNFSAYSPFTPSAINLQLRGGTASVSGDARTSTDLGYNLNWKFVNASLIDVIPDEGTSWYRTVVLSGNDLDNTNIYFNGELITDFITLTSTSASLLVPLNPPSEYKFTLG